MQLPPGAPPLISGNGSDPNGGPQPGTITGDPIQQTPVTAPFIGHPSILRRRPSTGQLGRPRGESISAMAKRVDFSLGMKDVSSGEQLSDVYEDRERPVYEEVIREANRVEDERRTSESRDRESTARSTSRDTNSHHMMSGILRRSTTQSLSGRPHRASISSQETHRNRFLNRFNRTGRSIDLARDSLAEEGQAPPIPTIDTRSGQVSSQAVRMDSNAPVPAEPFPAVGPTSSHEDFELRRLGQSSSSKQ